MGRCREGRRVESDRAARRALPRPRGPASGRSTPSTSSVTAPSAAPPVRRTTVLPLFSTCDATSTATFGRASKFAPTTPIGTSRSETRRPFGSVHARTSRSIGASSAVASSPSAMASIRSSSSRSRSSAPSSSLPVAAETSASLARSTSPRRSLRNSAASSRAAATASSESRSSAARAAAASRATRAGGVCSSTIPLLSTPMVALAYTPACRGRARPAPHQERLREPAR